ncbi:hypothetical protein [Lentzea guizhouensis]|uniref:hypothetical protein n=1 Tax=Lentzea guizhouensis TaxID=1586287 RepID=UPI0012B6AA66|nr:hypothetical protein [Lentzea guizhouensis]
MNTRLRDTGMSLDEHSGGGADGFIGDNLRELLYDAMFTAQLPLIIMRYRSYRANQSSRS